MELAALIDGSLVGRAERRGLEYADEHGDLRVLTFGALDQRATRVAGALAARGCVPGDRLCVHLANGLPFIELFLACVRLGVIFVPMNVLYRERELGHIVRDADPRAVVIARGGDATYPARIPLWFVEELGAGEPATVAASSWGPSRGTDAAAIIYTSGTTGTAKGAVLSRDNLAANAATITHAWRITHEDRYLAVLPLFHVHGLANGVLSWLLSGCFMRLEERFDHRSAADLFTRFRPTLFFGVPTIYVRLLDPGVIPDDAARDMGRHMRLFVSGSAPLPSHVHAAFASRFGHTILERYGMSEALMIAGNPYDGERRAGTVGRPFPGVSLRVAGETGPSAAGDVGEVQMKSPALFSGYWRNDTATAEAFENGWFRTGDVGVLSDDGYLTLRGRRGDLIISGGFNIYPREIEELLLEDSRVREAAVVGAPDALRGEVPVAYIVSDESVSVADLEQLCRAKLASFKTPRAFVRIAALPRTALGKVQKGLLPKVTLS